MLGTQVQHDPLLLIDLGFPEVAVQPICDFGGRCSVYFVFE